MQKNKLHGLVPLILSVTVSIASAAVHDGPDPLAHWILNQRSVDGTQLNARLGPPGTLLGDPEFVEDAYGQAMLMSGPTAGIRLAEDFKTVREFLPQGAFTVSTWCSVDTPQKWGSICGVIQDNNDSEQGWLIGYNQQSFYFGLSTKGADDGNGKMTYLEGTTKYQPGKLYHVVGVYDGRTMQLFVNGKLDAESRSQSGAILYPDTAPFTIGVYEDANEYYPHHGRIRDVAIYDLAAKPEWVKKQFQLNEQLAQLPPRVDRRLRFVVKPYLQMATRSSIVVSWQTSRPASGHVEFGETAEVKQTIRGESEKIIHHVKLDSLKQDTQYFYRVVSTANAAEVEGEGDEQPQQLASEVFTFQTAPDRSTPYAFAVISDTQGNPAVAGQIAEMAWEQRPSFLIHPGDLVSTGTSDTDWTQQFFPSMQTLISRVPIYPVLGNHELNARNYYDYMLLPEPEYFYQFAYGNADFFMIDSNKNVDQNSEQYRWLDDALARSTATWKFVVHHHPPYSSDENDYGNLWKTNRSTRGDLRVRKLVELYDRHQVDIVFNGHIHSYERTWPLKRDQPVQREHGTIYMITGGGGGGLETPGPFRTNFQNHVRRGHHFMMIHVNGPQLELRSYDLEGRLFDHLDIKK